MYGCIRTRNNQVIHEAKRRIRGIILLLSYPEDTLVPTSTYLPMYARGGNIICSLIECRSFNTFK